MEREEDIFIRCTLRPETLAAYGFIREEGGRRYREPFMDGDFLADVFIASDGSA